MSKEKNESEIWAIFNHKRNKVDILLSALDYMQQYNGRSTTDCIALAMGYTEGGDGKYKKENDVNS